MKKSFVGYSSGLQRYIASQKDPDKEHDNVEKNVLTWAKMIDNDHPGPMRSIKTNNAVDKAIEAHTDMFSKEERAQVSCKKGCAACCHLEVWISDDEADLLANIAKTRKMDIIDKLKKQKNYTQNDYLRVSREKASCVFLGDDKSCTIYESRPTACRNYQVSSDPKLCEPSKDWRMQMVTIVMYLMPEIIAAAASRVNHGSKKVVGKKETLAFKLYRRLK